MRPGLAAWALALAIAVAGCEPMQRQADDPGTAVARRASALAEQGRHDDAAAAYLQLASSAAGTERERYLIRAARERRLAGKLGGAQAILDTLPAPVSDANRLGWSQVAGDLAVATGQPKRALEIVNQAPPTSKSGAAAELLRIRGEALFRLDDPVAATRAFIEREVWLDSQADIAANQQMLWAGFQRYGGSLALRPQTDTADPVLSGWLDLGSIAATRRSGGSLGLALRGWQTSYPNHPANAVLVNELLADFGGAPIMPEQVALLLPLSGRQQAAGIAVRDGFIAAHYAATDLPSRPQLRIYDVDARGPVAAAQAAVADGAQFIVGPLLKESVQALASAGVAVPVLALNYLPDELRVAGGFYQFALAPEDEASAIADRALRSGQYRALVIAASNDWGRRLRDAFATVFQAQGGIIVDTRLYDPGEPDFSYDIRDALLIDESRDRHERLNANLGIELGFEPRRRDDIDLIFLGANDAAGKLIRPQLRFYYAGDIPTYATSAIYQAGSSNNLDLNGILFPDMPWIVAPDAGLRAVRNSIERQWPGQNDRLGRLYAMGLDAYSLVPLLAGGAAARIEIAGASGRLYLAGDGRIHRRLDWAVVRNGRPAALQPVQPIDDPLR